MKVAFDCIGTLLGPRKCFLLFKWFESKGCEMIIWSGSYSYTTDAKEKYDLEAVCKMKKGTYDYKDESDYMDIAVEDDVSQGRWLAAKKFIYVHDIPEDPTEFDKKYGDLLK